MVLPANLQLLPIPLLLAIVVAPVSLEASDIPWPLNLGRSRWRSPNSPVVKYVLPQKIVTEATPSKVRKMSADEGEMFFPEYWSFEAGSGDSSRPLFDIEQRIQRSPDYSVERDTEQPTANSSVLQSLQAPYALHSHEHFNAQAPIGRPLRSPRDIFSLDPRTFACPADTTACTSISRPNSCCPNGSSCQMVTDTGLGDVGCCGNGQSCGGQIAGCSNGDTSCPDGDGGGCCVAGYSCSGVGCAVSSTVVTTVQPIVTASPPTSSTTPSSVAQSAGPIVPVSSVVNSNTDTIVSTTTHTAITSVTSTATAPSLHISSTTHSSSGSAIAPIRPTSSDLPTSTTTAPPSTITASSCPTGFYQCSAYYHAGCCRVGRDCGLTSCPAASSTLAVNSDGVTVNVIPSGTGDAALGANGCAGGWFSCAAGQGGGCCPSGYACGTSCTATAVVVQGGQTGTATVAKDNGVESLSVRLWVLFVTNMGLALVSLYLI